MRKSKNMILGMMRDLGRADALSLRSRAREMDGTAIIAEEVKAPVFDGEKDYSEWPVGAPVQHEGQVYKLVQPHNAKDYDGTTATLPALWSITHTKDPAKAKPYMAPNGISGMYMTDECCTHNGKTWESLVDNNSWEPGVTGTESLWKEV